MAGVLVARATWTHVWTHTGSKTEAELGVGGDGTGAARVENVVTL